jgi:hypothetical protein
MTNIRRSPSYLLDSNLHRAIVSTIPVANIARMLDEEDRMSLSLRGFVSIVILVSALVLSACNQSKSDGGTAPVKALGTPAPISLSKDSGGFCVQNGVEGGNATMGTDGVSWTAPVPVTITLKMPCPDAAKCSYGPTPVSTGPLSPNDKGNTYPYASITVQADGSQFCTINNDGLIMR